jgi:hypothetical protein
VAHCVGLVAYGVLGEGDEPVACQVSLILAVAVGTGLILVVTRIPR